MHANVFTKSGCIYSSAIKTILRQNSIPFTETVMVAEEYHNMFPMNAGQSSVSIDDNHIGGFNELMEWLDNRPGLLVE